MVSDGMSPKMPGDEIIMRYIFYFLKFSWINSGLGETNEGKFYYNLIFTKMQGLRS